MNALFLALAAYAATPAPPIPYDGDDVAERVRAEYAAVDLPVAAPVVVAPCGFRNAYYIGSRDLIVVCSEDLGWDEGAFRFVVAHEMAHAAVAEHGLSQYAAEAGADELAAVVLELAGDRGAVNDGALLMATIGGGGKDDPHPAGLVRARALLCLDDGVDGDDAADPNCAVYWDRASASWIRLFDGK